MADGKAKLVAEVVGEYSAGRMFSAANKDMARTAKQGRALNNQMRLIRGGVGQLGHQFQDIAVQFQGGQSPFLILGQQGSQIVSLMGPHGAMVGAFVAIGAAIAGSMLPNLFGATEALSALEKEGESLVDRFDELDGVLKADAIRRNAQEIANLDEVISDAQKEMAELADKYMLVNAVSKKVTGSEKRLAEGLTELAVRIELASEAKGKLQKKTDGTSDATENLIKKLEKEAEALGKTKSELIFLDEAYKGALPTDQKRIEIAAQKIKAYEDELAAQKELAKETAKSNAEEAKAASSLEGLQKSLLSRSEAIDYAYGKELAIIQAALDKKIILEAEASKMIEQINAKRTQKTQDEQIAGAAAMTQKMGEALGEQTALGKAAFAAQKALAVAQILVDTERAAIAAGAQASGLGGIAGFFASAAGIRTVGYASAAMVASQAAASFEGGGFTGSGSRSGGVDGKGGFSAILHPNETVIDHTKGQGANGVVVNQTINVTTGIQSTVRAEIIGLMPQIAQAAKGAVADARVRGGNFSRAMVGA